MRAPLRAGTITLLASVLLLGCRTAQERRADALRVSQATLSGALQRYAELRQRATSVVGGAQRLSETLQEEILDLERRIEETRAAIGRIQSGVGEVTGGVQDFGQAVGGTPAGEATAPGSGDPQEMTTGGEVGSTEEAEEAAAPVKEGEREGGQEGEEGQEAQ